MSGEKGGLDLGNPETVQGLMVIGALRREVFAGFALQGLLASGASKGPAGIEPGIIAAEAYRHADAMIEAGGSMNDILDSIVENAAAVAHHKAHESGQS